MSDPRIERALRRDLAPVSAPEGLWHAIHRKPLAAEPERGRLDWAFWPAAAVMLMLALAGMLRSYTINDVHAASVDVPAGAQNCHTPNFAARSMVAVALERNSHEGCLACHLSMPGMLMMTRP
jgi:hypothetical protein